MFQCNEHVEIHKFLCSLACTLMTTIDSQFHMGLDARKPVFRGLRTIQAQSSLISALVIRFIEGFICKLAAGEISIF